ncbi:MAG: T9SS type A sorting domain-containing protein [Flavobacteriales bacterium]
MKLRLLIPSVALIGFAVQATAQVPNGGFETWTTVGTYLEPANWITFNSLTSLGGVDPSCEQGSPGAVGGHYATVTTRNTAFGIFQGLIISGDPVSSTAGFPYTSRPAAFTGKWQYAIQPQDTGLVVVYFSKWNNATQSSDSIGGGAVELLGTLSGWQDMNIPITYFTAAIPDTAYILIASSRTAAVEGSFIKVDNLGFGTISGINEDALAVQAIKLFHSPATDAFIVSAERPIQQVKVMDMTGRTVLEQGANAAELTVNVADLKAGRYLVQLQFANGDRQVRSLVKQ